MNALETALSPAAGPVSGPAYGQLSWEQLGWQEPPVTLAHEEALTALNAVAAAKGYLCVQLAPPGAHYRGRLGLYIEEAIENELENRGALAPGIQASTGLDGSLADQLYRARLLNMTGLALTIPDLEGITNLGRVLDADDSSVLRWWLAATADRPVRLLIHEKNSLLRVYPAPVLFESLFDHKLPVSPRAPSVAMAESSETMELSSLPPSVTDTSLQGTAATVWDGDEFRALDRALGISESAQPGAVEERELAALQPSLFEIPAEASALEADTDVDGVVLSGEQHLEELLESPVPPSSRVTPHVSLEISRTAPPKKVAPFSPSDFLSASTRDPAEAESPLPTSRIERESFLRALEEESSFEPEKVVEAAPALETSPTPLPTKQISAAFEGAPEDRGEIREAQSENERATLPAAPDELSELPVAVIPKFTAPPEESSFLESAPSPEAPPEPAREPERAPVQAVARKAPPAQAEIGPFFELASREWRTWVNNLDAARGPKPLSVIERMFVTDYTRLAEARRLGIADESADVALRGWQESFAQSYSEAFDSLRVRGKRPTMVLDVPDMAHRLGRLQGARRVQLLLVDALRFDLGLLVQDRLKARADAALTERFLLWSALPTCTSYQLELLGKGAAGLKETGETDEPPALVARGRAAMTPRRVRTGQLEIYKLDVVEDSLRDIGEPVIDRLPSIADRTADAIIDFFQKQPPKTMVVVFGDHGFRLDPNAAGTSEEVVQGGSTPEEVLVPAFAWLTGAVH